MMEKLIACGLTEQSADIQGETVFDGRTAEEIFEDVLLGCKCETIDIREEMLRVEPILNALKNAGEMDCYNSLVSIWQNVKKHCGSISRWLNDGAEVYMLVSKPKEEEIGADEPKEVEEFCGEQPQSDPKNDKPLPWYFTKKEKELFAQMRAAKTLEELEAARKKIDEHLIKRDSIFSVIEKLGIVVAIGLLAARFILY